MLAHVIFCPPLILQMVLQNNHMQYIHSVAVVLCKNIRSVTFQSKQSSIHLEGKPLEMNDNTCDSFPEISRLSQNRIE